MMKKPIEDSNSEEGSGDEEHAHTVLQKTPRIIHKTYNK